ncbi:MAG: hypothetical protein ABEI98_12595 [Halorhabdus sp.]
MAEQTEERPRERSTTGDVDTFRDGADRERPGEATPTGRLTRLRRTARSVFSVRSFLLSTVATVVGAVAVGAAIPFFGSLAALGGVFAAAFVVGLVGDRRRYLEVGAAGALTAVLGTLTEFFAVALLANGQLLAAVGAASGLLAALLGHYFGRDMRSGLTRDI